MIVAETSVWVDFFNGARNRESDLLDSMLSSQPILMGDLISAELLQGLRYDRDYLLASRELVCLRFANMVGPGIALSSARNDRTLRKRGIAPSKTIDVLIATFCICNQHKLLQRDKDFDAMIDIIVLEMV